MTGVATLQTPQAKTSMPTMINSQPQVRALRPGRVSIGIPPGLPSAMDCTQSRRFRVDEGR
jgi:hypothetical protein